MNINLIKQITFFFFSTLLIWTLFSAMYTVESGTRKIVLTAGEATSVATEGLNFKMPF